MKDYDKKLFLENVMNFITHYEFNKTYDEMLDDIWKYLYCANVQPKHVSNPEGEKVEINSKRPF